MLSDFKYKSKCILRNKSSQQDKSSVFKRHENFANSVESFYSSLRSDKRKKMKTLMNRLLRLSLKYQYVDPYQWTLANEVDVSRQYANTLLKELEEAKLLTIHNRNYNSCVYFPNEKFFGEARGALSNLFPALKAFGLWMLMSFNMSSESVLTTPMSSKRLEIINKGEICNFSRESYGVNVSGILNATTRSGRIMELISAKNRNLSAEFGYTDYARLINAAFDDPTLQIAYTITKKHRKNVTHLFAFFHAVCKKVAKMQGKQVNWIELYDRLDAAGFKRGSKLLLSDEEAQPLYDDPAKYLKREDCTTPKQAQIRSLGAAKWQAQFPIPDWVKKNG